ncbi:hypothetical protein D3C77_382750 [compost metagenome]
MRSPVDSHTGDFVGDQCLGRLSDVVIFHYQLPDLAPDPVRHTPALALDVGEAGKIDRTISIQYIRAGAAQLLDQRIGANENGRTIVSFQRQQSMGIVQGFTVGGIAGTCGRCQLPGFYHPYIIQGTDRPAARTAACRCGECLKWHGRSIGGMLKREFDQRRGVSRLHGYSLGIHPLTTVHA